MSDFEKIKHMTLEQLLGDYPAGFSVSADGHVYRIVTATSHLFMLVSKHPVVEGNAGYLYVEPVEVSCE